MASNNSSLEQLTALYKYVIDDVVRNMRDEYLNEGMDSELLEELKTIWLSKLSLSGAVNRPVKPEIPRPKEASRIPHKGMQLSGFVHASLSGPSSSSTPSLPPPLLSAAQSSQSSSSSTTTAESAMHHTSPPKTTPTPTIGANTLTPVNIPGMISTAGHVTAAAARLAGVTPAVNPFSAISGIGTPAAGQIGQLAQGMVPIQTPRGPMLVNLQTFMALTQLKQQQQQKKQQPQPQAAKPTQSIPSNSGSGVPEKDKNVLQIDGTPPIVGVASTGPPKLKKHHEEPVPSTLSTIPTLNFKTPFCFPGMRIVQLDGFETGGSRGVVADESSSDDNSDLDDSSVDDPVSGPSACNSPLNSDDDIEGDDDDPEANNDFETQDTIVCQWEKVYRVKSKWKFQLKDGVMHLGGFDYVFHKVAGEADW